MFNHCEQCQQIQKQVIGECEFENSASKHFSVSPGRHQTSNEYEKFHHQQQKIRKLAQRTNGCCSKHFRCISHKNQKQNQQIINISLIPPHLLQEEQPIFVDIHPQKPILNIYNVDGLVTQNLNAHKRAEKQQEKIQKQTKKKQQQKLDLLAQEAKKALRKSKKKDIKNSATWGHSIFTVNEPDNEKDKQGRENHQPEEEEEKRKKIQMKPIEERISEYKKSHKEQIKNKQQIEKCRHNHHHEKEIKVNVKENAEKILDTRKKEKEKQEQRKKAIEAKIRAIQIHSKENVKKSKKAPVDPNGEFIVQIPNGESKRKKKQKPKQSKKSEENEEKKIRRDFLKRSSKSLVNTKKSTKSIKKQTLKSQNEQEKKEQIEIENDGFDGKFYVWNVPILKQDYRCIVEGQSENLNINLNLKKGKGFREEVDEYLQEKFHVQMKNQVQNVKKKQFNMLVQEKKKQYLTDYIEENMEEVYWNQDEVFKPEKIRNFAYS